MEFLRADFNDLKEILAIQKRAFAPIARYYNNPNLGPINTTLEEISSSFHSYRYLKAVKENKIVGSLRLKIVNGSCNIENVIVDPNYQKLGIGTMLVTFLESQFDRVDSFRLLTGLKTPGNVSFYQGLGYKIIDTLPATETTPTLVTMEKIRTTK